MPRRLLATLVLLGLLPLAHGAGLLVADGGLGGVLEIEEHEVSVTITNSIAVTQVTQVFRNTENRQVEALYTFPVPRGASISDFSMWIAGKEMVGEVVEKQRARQIYESYKRARRDPGLLEQVDFKTFEMRIFPIGPGALQKVRLTYYQELDHDHDQATYVYPLATASRPGIDARARKRFAFGIDVTSPIPITAFECPSHAEDLVKVQHAETYCHGSLEIPEGSLQRDVVITYDLERPRSGLDLVTSRRDGEDGFFYLTLTAGKDLEELDQEADYVMVLDVSGSMATDLKMDRSRHAVRAFIDILQPGDRLELLAFSAAPEVCFRQLQPVTDEARRTAGDFLERQRPAGGTRLNPALELAYQYRDPDRPLNVVVLSDGMTETDQRAQLHELIRQRPAGVRTFCIGIGNEIDRPLLEQVAREAGGLAAFLSTEERFDRQARAFRRKLVHPVATDVRLSFTGGEIHDVEPPVLPELYHGAPLRVYGRYGRPGPVTITLEAQVLGSPIQESYTVELPARDDQAPQIERMWAWHRMNRLQEEIDAVGRRPALVDEVVRLGEGFSIAGEYTSFIVLENDAEYQRWAIERRNALRLERDQDVLARARQALETLRQESLARLGPATPEQQQPADTRVANRRSAASPTPAQQQQARRSSPQRRRSNGWNLNLPTGGGALDPVTATALLGVAALAFGRRRRRRSA